MTLTLRNPDGSLICQDEVVVTVIALDVRWYTSVGGQPGIEIVDANLPDLDDQGNPVGGSPANVGFRYFPGAETEEGDWNKEVVVVVQTNPPVGGVPLWLKAFDPDDPSYDGEPVDDNGPDGDDNDNQEGGTISGSVEFSGTTDAVGDYVGALVVVFRTAVQPGDNHRVAATLKQAALNVLTETAPPPGPPQTQFQVPASDDEVQMFIGDLSPLLTVWRELHIEIDSMRAEPQTVNDRAPDWDEVDMTAVTVDEVAGTSTITLLSNAASDELHHYEGGTLTVGGLQDPLFIVRQNGRDLEIDRVLTQEEQDTVVGSPGILRDDDPMSGQLPQYPAVSSFVVAAYSRAYIEPSAIEGALNPNTLVNFDLNLTDREVQLGLGWDNAQDVFSSNQYWAALMVMAYQPAGDSDQDPDGRFGVNDPVGEPNFDPDPYTDVGVTVEDSDNASVIFVETIRDVGELYGHDLDHTIAHEIGHSAGDNTSPEDDHAEGGIMRPGAPVSENAFTPSTIKRFRGCEKW